ncbi:6-phosphogluconolactonase [Rhodopirellula maiorica SM1]|uniref:6-phosphogluconolactonase n=1 Tax=Rhodopirellula maiorica SM1 TaxID=1265738 RepID=M5RA08_9BACT|nr:lactonase family protein [Rhodopirellula maiorica]EMI16220.1 6-phosphogluconolactonase [Rhodopirellula maiorica SM1]
MRPSILSLFGLLLLSLSVAAGEPVVFVSAFKSGDEGAIHAFRFDTQTGALKRLDQSTDIGQPFFMALSPNGQFLYAIDTDQFGGDEDEWIAAYAVEGETGKLTRLNRQSARGTASCYLDVDANGRSVVVANYASGSVAALPVREDGSLEEAASFIQHEGSSVDAKRQKGPFAHSIVISPDNRFALAADLGLDKVLIYRLDAATGKLVANDVQPFARLPPGSGPRHLTFDPSGNRVYVINELKNTVTYFTYAADSGRLTPQQTISTLPEGFTGSSYCADLKITPDGQFLYGTNRGHDSIAIYRIGSDGRLSLTGIESSLGGGPQNLLITSDGRWLLCANMTGNNVRVFRIDSKTGGLTAIGDPVSVSMPSCLRWLPAN